MERELSKELQVKMLSPRNTSTTTTQCQTSRLFERTRETSKINSGSHLVI